MKKEIIMGNFRGSPTWYFREFVKEKNKVDLLMRWSKPEIAVLVPLKTANRLEANLETYICEFTATEINRPTFTKFIHTLTRRDIIYITSNGKRIGALVSPHLVS